MPRETLPLGRHGYSGWDRHGNPFGIEAATGRVVVQDYGSGEVEELAPSLEEFLLKGVGEGL